MSEESPAIADPGPRLAWLDRYASKDSAYQWQRLTQGERTFYHRPLGLVEDSFDCDGRYHEGRADINAQLTVEVRSDLGDSDLRERILHAWSTLRLHHAMLRAKALRTSEFLPSSRTKGERDVHFVVERSENGAVAREEASRTIAFLGDHYASVDVHEFHRHTQNTARVVDPAVFLAKLFVLPVESSNGEPRTRTLRFLLIAAHQIAEGLTMLNWFSHFLVLFNNPPESVDLESLFSPQAVRDRFPLAQETLYPRIPGSRARRRWFWALTLVLRHVNQSVQQGLVNPLRREIRIPNGSAVSMPPKFAAVLDYSRTPPINTFFTGIVKLSRRATRRLHGLCRAADTSIGAGTFALAALAAMELSERLNPGTPLDKRAPFVCSFPLNPRAMFTHSNPPDSLMLAFSQGISLPFLPSHLAVDGRLKILARAAHRQLRVYQKRAPKTLTQQAELNPLRILATNYIASVERSQMLLPPELRSDTPGPQGGLSVQSSFGRATHGVSALGAQKGVLRRGVFPLDSDAAFAADYRDIWLGPRARDNEFLVATAGDEDHVWTGVSYDGNALDEEMVERWKEKIAGLLESEDDGKL